MFVKFDLISVDILIYVILFVLNHFPLIMDWFLLLLKLHDLKFD